LLAGLIRHAAGGFTGGLAAGLAFAAAAGAVVEITGFEGYDTLHEMAPLLVDTKYYNAE